jgi:divalent metal cation (Fe/Co/Zn/Cd) transporter
MPGIWNIHKGHNLAEKIEKDIRMLFPDSHITVFTHLEPIEEKIRSQCLISASIVNRSIFYCKIQRSRPDLAIYFQETSELL